MNDLISKVTPDLITGFMGDLKPLASAGLGLYFLWLLVPLLLNSERASAQDVMTKVLAWLIIFAFAFNSGNLLHQVNSSVNEFYAWASGGKTIVATLDGSYAKIVDIGKSLYKADTDTINLRGAIANILVMLSYYVFGFLSMSYIIFSKFIISLLLLSLPLTILALVFPPIKDMFAKWLQLFIENILTVLFLNIIFNIVQNQLTIFIAEAEIIAKSPNSGDLLSIGMDVSAVILFLLIMVYISRQMAKHLASASLTSSLIDSAGSAAGSAAGSVGRAMR